MITKGNDLLGTLIHDVAYLLRHEIDDRLRPYNLTRVKWLALGVIDSEGPLSQAELADTLELGVASVGRLVDRLEKRGFVIRKPNPNDRRSYQLTLSETAKDLIRELEGLKDDLSEETLGVLSKEEISTVKKGLSKLKKQLKAGPATAGAFSFVAINKLIPFATAWSELAIFV